jgi:polyisoprenoid-binding protein YceI
VKGKLTIHGITKDVEIPGIVIVKDGKVQLNSSFNVLLADYNITIPMAHRGSISNSIKVLVDCTLDPMKK